LPLEDVAPDRPVEHHHLLVDGEGGFDLGGADALLEVFEETIVGGWDKGIGHKDVLGDKGFCPWVALSDLFLDLGDALIGA
jgi:hypothetical protein